MGEHREYSMYSDYIIVQKNVKIDRLCRTVVISDKQIILSAREFDTLCLLAEHPGWIYSKEQIYKLTCCAR